MRFHTRVRSRGNPLWLSGLGVVILILAVYLTYDSYSLIRVGRRTTGKIIEITHSDERCGGSGRRRRSYPCTVHRGIVSFPTESGSVGRLTVSAGSNRRSCTTCTATRRVGEEVPVIYDPANPSRVKQNTFFSLWGGGLICAVFGALFGIFGLVASQMDHNEQVGEQERAALSESYRTGG